MITHDESLKILRKSLKEAKEEGLNGSAKFFTYRGFILQGKNPIKAWNELNGGRKSAETVKTTETMTVPELTAIFTSKTGS